MAIIVTTLLLFAVAGLLIAGVAQDKDMLVNAVITFVCAGLLACVPHVLNTVSKFMEVAQ